MNSWFYYEVYEAYVQIWYAVTFKALSYKNGIARAIVVLKTLFLEHRAQSTPYSWAYKPAPQPLIFINLTPLLPYTMAKPKDDPECLRRHGISERERQQI